MKIEQELIERLRALPEERKEDLLRYVAELEELEREGGPGDDERVRAARRWIDDHRTEYAGQWVALDGDRLVASGTDGRQVVERVRGEGIEGPYLTRIDAEDEAAFCGGWL